MKACWIAGCDGHFPQFWLLPSRRYPSACDYDWLHPNGKSSKPAWNAIQGQRHRQLDQPPGKARRNSLNRPSWCVVMAGCDRDWAFDWRMARRYRENVNAKSVLAVTGRLPKSAFPRPKDIISSIRIFCFVRHRDWLEHKQLCPAILLKPTAISTKPAACDVSVRRLQCVIFLPW